MSEKEKKKLENEIDDSIEEIEEIEESKKEGGKSEWQKKIETELQELKQMFSSNPQEQEKVQKIPVPKAPEKEEEEPEQIQEPSPKPPKRKFLDWLM